MNKLGYLFFALVVVALAGCNTTIPVRNYMDQPIAQYGQTKNTVDSVEKSILKGALMLGWKTEIKAKGQIIATLDIRTHQLVVLITHDDQSFSVEYQDSINLKYDGTKIHRQYGNWVTNLIRSINAQSITG